MTSEDDFDVYVPVAFLERTLIHSIEELEIVEIELGLLPRRRFMRRSLLKNREKDLTNVISLILAKLIFHDPEFKRYLE